MGLRCGFGSVGAVWVGVLLDLGCDMRDELHRKALDS